MFQSLQLVNVGAHIGSSKQCWITLTSRFIFGFRNNITLINLNYTTFHLRRALLFVKKTVSKGGRIMINSLYVKTHSGLINRFYQIGQVVAPNDWIGGYLSNYRNLKVKLVSKRRSRSFVSALINLNYNLDNRFIASEARNCKLPIISIFDTNSQSSIFDYPIPSNNKNSSIRTFYGFLFSSAVFSGIVRRVNGAKRRSIIRTFVSSGKIDAFITPFSLHPYADRYSIDKDLFSEKHKSIYINTFKKVNNSKSRVFINISRSFNKLLRLEHFKFTIFKNNFIFNDFVNTLELISGSYVSRRIEHNFIKANNIKLLFLLEKKRRINRARFLLRREKIKRLFLRRRRFHTTGSFKLRRFSKSVRFKFTKCIFGINFKRKKFSFFTVSEYINNFFRSYSRRIRIYSWRVEFSKLKRYSSFYRTVISRHKKVKAIKYYFFNKKNSRKLIRRASTKSKEKRIRFSLFRLGIIKDTFFKKKEIKKKLILI